MKKLVEKLENGQEDRDQKFIKVFEEQIETCEKNIKELKSLSYPKTND
jgi:hypothetical protein